MFGSKKDFFGTEYRRQTYLRNMGEKIEEIESNLVEGVEIDDITVKKDECIENVLKMRKFPEVVDGLYDHRKLQKPGQKDIHQHFLNAFIENDRPEDVMRMKFNLTGHEFDSIHQRLLEHEDSKLMTNTPSPEESVDHKENDNDNDDSPPEASA